MNWQNVIEVIIAISTTLGTALTAWLHTKQTSPKQHAKRIRKQIKKIKKLQEKLGEPKCEKDTK